jgi:hypothetical protein
MVESGVSTIALTPITRVTYNVEGYGDSFDAPGSILGLFLYVLCGPSFCCFIEILSTDQLVYLYNLGIVVPFLRNWYFIFFSCLDLALYVYLLTDVQFDKVPIFHKKVL